MTLIRLSHPVYAALDCFVTLLHDAHHIRIKQVDEKIRTQQDDNGRETNTHEFVLLKDREVSVSYRRTHRDNQQRNQSVHRLHQVRIDHIPNRRNRS